MSGGEGESERLEETERWSSVMVKEGRKGSNYHPEGWQPRAKGRRKRRRQTRKGREQTDRKQVCQRHTNRWPPTVAEKATAGGRCRPKIRETQEPGTADGEERYQEAEFHKRKVVHQELEVDDQAHVKSSSGMSLYI